MCSVAVPLLYPRTQADAIARLARTRCLRGHREKTEICGACFDCRCKGEQESRFLKNEYNVRIYVRRSCSSYSSIKFARRVRETANSIAWNHAFNFQRRGPPRRRPRKLLSLCHTHGSSPRNPYLPCQIVVQRKSLELEQNYGMSYLKN